MQQFGNRNTHSYLASAGRGRLENWDTDGLPRHEKNGFVYCLRTAWGGSSAEEVLLRSGIPVGVVFRCTCVGMSRQGVPQALIR